MQQIKLEKSLKRKSDMAVLNQVAAWRLRGWNKMPVVKAIMVVLKHASRKRLEFRILRFSLSCFFLPSCPCKHILHTSSENCSTQFNRMDGLVVGGGSYYVVLEEVSKKRRKFTYCLIIVPNLFSPSFNTHFGSTM